MTTVTLFAGDRTIGGTQIVVEDQGARLHFDIGLPFDPATDPFTHVSRRPGRELSDLIDLGLLPYLPIYAPEHVARTSRPPLLPPAEGPVAVALSHSHLDHSHLAGAVADEIPLWATPPAGRIVRQLGIAGSALVPVHRSMNHATGPVQIGPMRVTFQPVDHDVGGASGLIIETSRGTIAYSGDLRLHGAYPERSLAFARVARDAGTCLLILEGTRLRPPEPETVPHIERPEADVAPAVERILRDTPGLGVILLTPENGERVQEVACAAERAGRLFVADPDSLAFAEAALGHPLNAPHALYNETLVAEISAHPGDFLLALPFERFAELLALNPRDGVVITSNGPPLGSFDPAYAHMQRWAERLGMQVADASSTGHAAPSDLAIVAALSGASTVMSIHSRFPELMPVPPERLLLPEPGRPHELGTLP